MNKLAKYILSMTLAFSSLVMLQSPIITPVEVQADVTSLACGTQYEVAVANTNGTFTKMSCHNSFSDAQNTMWGYGENAVVRHHASKSPMKIIAMDSKGGVAISYPMRSNSSTMDIIQDHSNSNRKATYVTKHREMIYNGTNSYNGSGSGKISVNITGFEGLAELVNVDLVPYVFMGNQATVLLGGNDTTAANEQPFWTHIYQAHYEVKQNGANKELTYVAYSGWSSDTWPAVYTMTIGLAADWMNVGTNYYSKDGYNFYSDGRYRNKVGTYYNYYQFLPTRTKTNIPAAVFDSFLISVKGNGTNSKMKNQGQTFINAQNNYGMNALLIYSLACLESAYGTSNFALDRNNLFGWNAFDSDPGSASWFSSIESAVNEHMGINLRGYTNINDSRFFGSHVGNKGSGFNVKYAADPYWGYKIAAIAYSIDKAAGFADYNKYSIGVINAYGVNVLKSPNGATLFNSAYGATYQENFTVAILGNESNHYKIQSTNPVAGGNIVTGDTKGLVNYDWNGSVGFIPTSKVNTMNSNTPPVVEEPGTKPDGEFAMGIDSFIFSKGKLTITGYAYQPGIYINDLTSVKHYLVLTNSKNVKTEIELDKSIYGKENYAAAGFLGGLIDLTNLPKDEKYTLSIKTVHEKYTTEKSIFNVTGNEFLLDNYVYTMSSSTSLTSLEIKKRIIPEKYITSFEGLVINEDSSVTITGIAYVEGKNNTSGNVKHKFNIINLEDDKVVSTVDLTSSTGEYDPTLYSDHGLDYSYCWYSGTIPVGSLPIGEYKINIVTTVDGKEYTSLLIGGGRTPEIQSKAQDSFTLSVLKQMKFKGRIEIQKNLYDIAINSPKPLPTKQKAYQYISSMSYNESNNSLLVKGTGYIMGANFSKDSLPKYTLYLIDAATGNIVKSSSEGKEKLSSPNDTWWDNSANQKFDYSNTWYEIEFNCDDIADGKYIAKLLIETKDYAELVEISLNSSEPLYTYTNGGKTINASRNKYNKLRLEIDIKGLIKAKLDASSNEASNDTTQIEPNSTQEQEVKSQSTN